MALYFRPIKLKDKNVVAKGASSSITRAPYSALTKASIDAGTVMSTAIFGEEISHREDKIYQYEDEYTKVGYIDLNEEIINPFLAGANYPIWAILSGYMSSTVKEIIKYNKIFDKNQNCLVETSTVRDVNYSENRFVVGVKHLIDVIDSQNYEERVNSYLKKFYINKIETILGLSGLDQYISEFTSDTAAIYLSDSDVGILHLELNYILDLRPIRDLITDEDGYPTPEYDAAVDFCTENETEDMAAAPDQFNVLQILDYAKRHGTQFIKNQVMPIMFVLPIGYRPEIRGRQSETTIAYNDIVRYNSILADTKRRNDNTVNSYTMACRNLQTAVEYLLVGNDSKQSITYKSLADELKGKKGFVRDKLEGARIDFSGRTVITLDPELPIDTVGIPIKMLEKIAEPMLVKAFTKEAKGREDWHVRKNMTTFHNATDASKFGISFIDFLKYYFDTHDIYGLIGRQPTLFYLGIQGFKIRPIEGDAITLSPLVVMPFNADFDGDQMHFSIPVTAGGVKDVREKMLFKDNIWYPKDGSITVVVRHEIQYGIWEALTRTEGGDSVNCKTRSEAYDGLCRGALRVEDTCLGTTVGRAAFDYCICGDNGQPAYDFDDLFKKADSGQPRELNEKNLSKMLYKQLGSTERFLSAINKLVKLGFSVSKFYPPAIGVITNSTINDYIERRVKEFNMEMVDYKKFVDIGMESEERYNMHYSDEYSKLEKELKKYIRNNLDKNNGYWRMVVSGSKGNDSNLLQIYGIKGRVQKSDLEAFNTTIDGSYARQLTGFEHFVTGYGSRKGICDKVLSTAEPGYMSRKLEHAGAPLRITEADCSDGGEAPAIEFYPEDVIPFIEERMLAPNGIKPSPDDNIDDFYRDEAVSLQLMSAKQYLANILVGRYVVTENGNSVYIEDRQQAMSYISSCWKQDYHEGDRQALEYNSGSAFATPVRMRSPITCNNPCCQMCYGRDLSKNTRKPAINRNVGFIAAQAIGEPGTQMTMKNFQKGGVVGDANLTSSFELIESNFDLKDFTKGKYDNGIVKYDPVAPKSGFVKLINMGGNKSQVIITKTSHVNDKKNLIKTPIFVDRRARLKNYVYKGDTLFFELGNVAVRDLIRHRSFEGAYKHLLLNLYTIFSSTSVNSIHFECIIRNMITYQVITNNCNGRFTPGDIITYNEKNEINGDCLIPKIVGVKYLPKYKSDFLQCLAMESCTTYIPRAIVQSNTDSMTDPIMRTAFGLSINK